MNRPASIVMFERLYLGSFALWLINTAVFWSANTAAMQQAPGMSASPGLAGMLGSMLLGGVVLTAGVSLLLWYLVARRGSEVAKWFVVVFEAVGALTALFGLLALAKGNVPNVPGSIIGLIVTALAVASAVFLFKPDTKAWFGETPAGPPQA